MSIGRRETANADWPADPTSQLVPPEALGNLLGDERRRAFCFFGSRKANWRPIRPLNSSSLSELRHEEWFAERLRVAITALRDCIVVSPRVRGGVPVLKGTRVPISQILAELAEDQRVSDVAEDLQLDGDAIRRLLEGIAGYLDRPFVK